MSVLAIAGHARGVCHPSMVSALCVSLIVFLAAVYARDSMASLGGSGYLGILAIGVVGGVVGAMGGLTGYLLGTRSSQEVESRRAHAGSMGLIKRWMGPSLFTFSLVPGPFMMASLWAGTVRYPVWRFLLYVTAGKAIKLTALVLVGYYSVPWLLGSGS